MKKDANNIPFNSAELSLRQRLGIPDDAKRVLIFTETSHWDPNWLRTSEEYFTQFVQPNLDQALDELQEEPRRIYSVECIFFLRMYWDRNPGRRDELLKMINNGRLRLTGSGVTTPDTLLPDVEAILRDMLTGQEWLRENGMKQEPRLAYFPDSFGCTPALPTVLQAAGFDRTAITRIDGMYFMGCEPSLPRNFPKAGSSAKRLLKQERTLDFVWRDPNGASVLCHWNAFTYGQGDMLAYAGISRAYLARLAIPFRWNRYIAYRIRQYVSRLSIYSRTPYMLCPIGFDFVEPIPGLVGLLDRYNKDYYGKTGVWVVNAGMDDYFDLIEPYQNNLPVIELDPNPYWTGFYTSRPILKQRCRKLTQDLLLAEKLSFLPENSGAGKNIAGDLKSAWWTAAVSNHHDFITGTSSDRVVAEEQIPWLEQADTAVKKIIQDLTHFHLPSTEDKQPLAKPVKWSRKKGKIRITTLHYSIILDEKAGGSIVDLKMPGVKSSLLCEYSNDLVSFKDSGGLWRMGYEFAGGIWKESELTSRQVSSPKIVARDNGVEIVNKMTISGESVRRRMWLSNRSPIIYFRVEGMAATGHTFNIRFETGISSGKLVMDTPGGIITRPSKRVYDPTFWPVNSFFRITDEVTGNALTLFLSCPGAVCYCPEGRLEMVAMRNATKEKVLGLIGIPGNPASGHEQEKYNFEYSLLFVKNGGENNFQLPVKDDGMPPWHNYQESALRRLTDSLITATHPGIRVAVIKPASWGEGIIVRLIAPFVIKEPVEIKSSYFKISKAFLCDARERNIKSLDVSNEIVRLTMPGTIATIRLTE